MPEQFKHNLPPFQLTGEGDKNITLLNGFMRPQSDFNSLSKSLTQMGFRVLTLDFRGSGQHKTFQAFSIEDLALDVIALWEHLGIKTTMLLGISMGGVVAQTILSKNQTLPTITHTLLISTTRSPEDLQKPSADWGQNSSEILKTYVSKNFAERHAILLKAMGKAMDKAWKDSNTRNAAEFQRSALQNWKPEPIKIKETNSILVVHGDEDKIIPFSSANTIAKELKCDLKRMKGHGHLLIAEAMEELRNCITEFLI